MVAVTPADKADIARFCREQNLDPQTVQGVVVQENGTPVGFAFYQITHQLEILSLTSPVAWQDLLVRSLLNIGRLRGLDTAVFHCPPPAMFSTPETPAPSDTDGEAPANTSTMDTPAKIVAYTAPGASDGPLTISIPEFFEKSNCQTLQ